MIALRQLIVRTLKATQESASKLKETGQQLAQVSVISKLLVDSAKAAVGGGT